MDTPLKNQSVLLFIETQCITHIEVKRFGSVQGRFDGVDTSSPNNDEEEHELSTRLQRPTSSFDDVSTGSSAADLTYVQPVTTTSPSGDLDVAPRHLRDTFVDDLQFVEERTLNVPVAVCQSSSSSLSSEAEPRNNVREFYYY